MLGRLAALTDEVLVLGDMLGLEADAIQVEPELAAVALDPVYLQRNKANNG